MAFGQQSGPPATHSQIRELLELLEAAGHADFKDARGPMGFTQRQAGGKFTRDEADAFIAQLQEAEHAAGGADAEGAGGADAGSADAGSTGAGGAGAAPRQPKPSATEKALRIFTDEQLAAELQRRRWIVVEP
jgi:hypothetical protein